MATPLLFKTRLRRPPKLFAEAAKIDRRGFERLRRMARGSFPWQQKDVAPEPRFPPDDFKRHATEHVGNEYHPRILTKEFFS
jgi:hypothetical protein